MYKIVIKRSNWTEVKTKLYEKEKSYKWGLEFHTHRQEDIHDLFKFGLNPQSITISIRGYQMINDKWKLINRKIIR